MAEKKSVWHGRRKNVIKFSCWKLTAIGFTSSTNQIQFDVKSAIIHCRWMDYAPFVEHCSSNLKCFTRCFVIIVWWKTVLGVYVCGAYVRLWLICLWWFEYWSTTTQPRRQKCMYSVWSALVLVRQRANHRYIKQMRWKLKGKHQTFNLIYSASKYWMFKRHTYHTHANTCQKGCCRFDLTLLSSLSLRSIFSLFIIYSMQVANIDVMWLDA